MYSVYQQVNCTEVTTMGNTLNCTTIVTLYLQLISAILYAVFGKVYALLVFLIIKI